MGSSFLRGEHFKVAISSLHIKQQDPHMNNETEVNMRQLNSHKPHYFLLF